ncbi:MAG: tRNA1(Val) (adenine(37)-N6)-methyltransferase [Nitrospirota bacterium]|nr:MAG: tRNA1(Val) (adenine(37)-N6)-methyltransferase [Nitrospirota bacterium]
MMITLDTIKNVKLYQSGSGYRFTIDSVLLSEYVNKLKPHYIADVGSGNGVIGLLLAKRYTHSRVYLFEIQKGLHELALKNISLNRLKRRMVAKLADISLIMERPGVRHKFDVVVSNPPFRESLSGKISPYDEKAIARHEIKIDLIGLMSGISHLLKPKGSVYLIYHPERLVDLFTRMRSVNIEPKRVRFVHPDPISGPKMVLIQGVKASRASLKIEKPLFIYNKKNIYSDEVKEILR